MKGFGKPGMNYEILTVKEQLLADNDRIAAETRSLLQDRGVVLVNLMGSPGAGKTTTLLRLIERLGSTLRIGVMEADVDSDVDAKAVYAAGAKVVQLHTGGLCHMDAAMTAQGLEALGLVQNLPCSQGIQPPSSQNLPCSQGIKPPSAQNLPCSQAIQLPSAQNLPCSQGRGTALKGGGGVCPDFDLIFLENVGNLVCPAEFDVGADLRMMILSVPEGDDKPLKYPLMFTVSDVMLVNKIDTAAVFDFDLAAASERARKLNPGIQIFPVSAETGEGFDAVAVLLRELCAKRRSQA